MATLTTSILDSIKFWDGENWNEYAGFRPTATSYSTPFQNEVRGHFSNLASHASTLVLPILENLAANGGIRVGHGQVPGQWVAANFMASGNDAYMLVNPDKKVWAVNATGELFSMSTEVVIAHELGHAGGLSDPLFNLASGAVGDAMLNNNSYDYAGDALRFENQVADALGMENKRVSYGGSLSSDDARFGLLRQDFSYTDDQDVSIVRFGDQADGQLDNDIDFSDWLSAPGILAFGFTGADTMKGSAGTDHFWGGAQNDQIRGNDGNDRLFGEAGDDHLLGGAGSDVLDGGDGSDILDGGSGDEDYGIGDTIYAGHGDTVVNVDEFDTIYFEGRQLRGGDRQVLEMQFEPRSGTYESSDGLLYTYDRSARTIIVSDGIGTLTITGYDAQGPYAGDAGISLFEWQVMM